MVLSTFFVLRVIRDYIDLSYIRESSLLARILPRNIVCVTCARRHTRRRTRVRGRHKNFASTSLARLLLSPYISFAPAVPFRDTTSGYLVNGYYTLIILAFASVSLVFVICTGVAVRNTLRTI